jgi:acyl dehydratase
VLDKSFIGRTSEPLTLDVERGHIQRFAEAIGDPNPIYRDLKAAQAAGHPRIPAPPTFATALRPNDVREGIPLDWRRLLHGEQRFEYRRPLYAGDTVTVVQRIADIQEKAGKSGKMQLLILDTVATDASGSEVYTGRSTVVLR